MDPTINPYQAPQSQVDTSWPTDAPVTVKALLESYSVNALTMRRWLGCWIDFVLSFTCLLIPDAVLGNALYQQTMIIWVLLAIGYYLFFESVWGRTPGKFVARTVIVDENGNLPNRKQVAIRTAFRLIEVNPGCLGGMPAAVVVGRTKWKQRLGDMAAGTFVILQKDWPLVRGKLPGQAE